MMPYPLLLCCYDNPTIIVILMAVNVYLSQLSCDCLKVASIISYSCHPDTFGTSFVRPSSGRHCNYCFFISVIYYSMSHDKVPSMALQ